MTYQIEIQNEHNYPVDMARLRKAAAFVLSDMMMEDDTEMTIKVVDNAAIQALNRQFRAVDAPTDVLSFPSFDPEADDPEAYLGDIAIAYPYAQAQAAKFGHALTDTLVLLVVHGTLHLLGYTHDDPDFKEEMWDEQARLLTQLNVDPAIVPALEADDDDA